MPLTGGVGAFAQGAEIPQIPEAEFAGLLAKKGQIVEIFRCRPALALEPYVIIQRDGLLFAEQVASDHELVIQLKAIGLDVHKLSANDYFPSWEDVVFPAQKIPAYIAKNKSLSYWETRNPNVPSYALIDAVLYVVFLVNLYDDGALSFRHAYSRDTSAALTGGEQMACGLAATEAQVARRVPNCSSAATVARDIVRLMAGDPAAVIPARNNGLAFEKACMDQLLAAGFEVRPTPTSGDFGADIIAFKDTLGYAIQCKDFAKPVGVKAVQEAVAARSHYQVDYAVVCAAAGFTRAAAELATSNGVILSDLPQLSRRLEAV